MSLQIVTGSLADFLESAREIDAGQPLTQKQTLWIETEDLVQLLQPQRLRLVHYLKSHSRVVLLDLAQALQRQPRSVSRDLAVDATSR